MPLTIAGIDQPATGLDALRPILMLKVQDGLLRFDSGTLSFEPSSNGKRDEKRSDFRFSVQGAKIDGRLLVIPGKGKFCFPSGISQENMGPITYLELTVRSAE
jgi:hypothetical protein